MSKLQSLYQKLLTCYPRSFRQEFAASMVQNVGDLWREQQRQSLWRKLNFVVWLLLDTVISIVREQLAEAREDTKMKTFVGDIRSATIFSFVLTLPLVLLELIHKPGATGIPFQFPYTLFAVLWLAPLLFMLTLLPLVRAVRTGNTAIANPLLLLRVALLLFLALLWFGLMSDQLPCFLGVPNCD